MYSYCKLFSYFLVSAILLTLQSCSTVPNNLTVAKDEVIKYHESGEYEKELSQIVKNGINEFENLHAGKKSAVIFDIDETALSNYEYSKEYDFGYVSDLWDKWIEEAKAPAIKGVKYLYDFLVSDGFKIIFLTGRKDYQYNATYRNLINAGYTKFDTIIVRKPTEYEETAADYKSKKRTELVQQGYDIVGDIGDQISDLTGPYTGIKVKIPNYQYLIK